MVHPPESDLEWPDTQTGGGQGAPKWNLQTEDEEYLARLENKLARLQKDGPKPQPAKRHTSSDFSSLSDDEDSEDGVEHRKEHAEDEQTQNKDDDAGVHLLHDVELQHSYSPESENHISRDQAPSPENALHLRLGEASHHASESSSRSGLPSNHSPNTPEHTPVPPPHSIPPPEETKSRPFPFRVRFRSRVRIGSGIRHNRSRTSIDSSSPSSSISAPLRYSSYEGDQGTSYAQLITDVASGISGRHLTSSSSSSSSPSYSPYTTGKKFRRYGSGSTPAAVVVNERTPLFAAAPADSQGYVNVNVHHGHERRPSLSQIPDSDDAEGDEQHTQRDRDARLRRSLQQAPARRKTEEEVMFGRWPWRLFNGHWWLWKLEPICGCCYTDDETDSDLD